jgi:hypothetical protein
VFEEAALVLRSTEALSNQLTFERDPLPDTEAVEVFGEARLPLLVHHQDKLDIVTLESHSFIIIIYLVVICN